MQTAEKITSMCSAETVLIIHKKKNSGFIMQMATVVHMQYLIAMHSDL